MGRIMIPIKLREQMGLVTGREYYFSTLEKDGRRFICIDCGAVDSPVSLEQALQIIKKNGLKIAEDSAGRWRTLRPEFLFY